MVKFTKAKRKRGIHKGKHSPLPKKTYNKKELPKFFDNFKATMDIVI